MVTQTKPITGKIARILNSREVALNIGSENGVKSGMLFEVLSSNGYEIPDPDTGLILGSVSAPKVSLKITRVQEKVCVASTYRTKRVDIRSFSTSADMFKSPKWEKRYETLKTGGVFERDIEQLDEKDSYVSIGDPVVQVLDDQG